MKAPDHKKNPKKYCDYHQDKGHNTDEYCHLKNLIEKKIKVRELNHFVKDLRDKLGPREDRETEDRERYCDEIKTISWGSILDKDSNAAKKKYARKVYNIYLFNSAKQPKPISFTVDDYEDVIYPHEEPLVR